MVKYKKQDGSLVDFDVNRIIQKIMASQEAVGQSSFDEALSTAMTVQGRFLHSQEVTGKELNHFTEHLLMGINRDVARAFIERRVALALSGE